MYLSKLKYLLLVFVIIFLINKLFKLMLLCALIFFILLIIDSTNGTTKSSEVHKKTPIYEKGKSDKNVDDVFPNLDKVEDLIILDDILDDDN